MTKFLPTNFTHVFLSVRSMTTRTRVIKKRTYSQTSVAECTALGHLIARGSVPSHLCCCVLLCTRTYDPETPTSYPLKSVKIRRGLFEINHGDYNK